MTEFLLILGMMTVTFAARYPVLALVGRIRLPERVFHALRYVPVAVLTAISVPEVLMPQDSFNLGLDNAHLVAGLVAVLISWRTRNLLWTIVIGMTVFLLWRGLTGTFG